MTPELTRRHHHAWDLLEQATHNKSSPFRLLTLCTIQINNTEPAPDARILVLRKTHRKHYQLEFHTDIRSAKWSQLIVNPIGSIIGYDTDQQQQLRLQGTITLFDPGTTENAQAWEALAPWTKNTYCGPPPGSPLGQETTATASLETSTVDEGMVNFGLMKFSAKSLDYVELKRNNNTRAHFDYHGPAFTAQWIAP